jgi:hypothetical protein
MPRGLTRSDSRSQQGDLGGGGRGRGQKYRQGHEQADDRGLGGGGEGLQLDYSKVLS